MGQKKYVFYTDKNAYEKWIEKKRQLLTKSFDRDEQTKKLLENKLVEIDMEICEYNMLNQRINQEQQRKPERTTEGGNKALETYRRVMLEKQSYLDSSINYMNFIQEYCEVIKLLTLLKNNIDNNEFGETLEEIEAQIRYFETSYEGFTRNESKIHKCLKTGNDLTQSDNKYKEEIQTKLKQLNQLYIELKSLANDRNHVLLGAKRLLLFESLVGEILDWIDELHLDFLRFDKALKRIDRANAKINLSKFESFCSDLQAIDEKVSFLEDEAEEVINLYPTTEQCVKEHLVDLIVSVEDLNIEFEKRREKLPALPPEISDNQNGVANSECTTETHELANPEGENLPTKDSFISSNNFANNVELIKPPETVFVKNPNLPDTEGIVRNKEASRVENAIPPAKQKIVQFSTPEKVSNPLTKKPSIKVRRVHSIAEMLKNKGITFKNSEIMNSKIDEAMPQVVPIKQPQSFLLGLRNSEKYRNESTGNSILPSQPPPRPPKRKIEYTSYPIASVYSTKINNDAAAVLPVEHISINVAGSFSSQGRSQDITFADRSETRPIIGTMKEENSISRYWHVVKKAVLDVVCFKKLLK